MTIQLGPDLNDEVEIARYMSFSAFMYMLEFRKAFVPSIANLRSAPGNHGDPTEGRWGPMDEFMRERIERRNAAVHGDAAEGSAAPSRRMKFDHTTKPDRGDK